MIFDFIKIIRKKTAKYYKQLLLFRFYIKKVTFSNNIKKPQIVICFDGNIPHGGLVDRLKGIISFYEVSKILDFEFKILYKSPFELKDFLEPNLINWIINDKDLKYPLISSKILYLMNDFNANPLELIRKSKAKTFFIYANVDYLSVLHKDKAEDELKEIWRNNYNELFRTSDYLKEKISLLPNDSRIVFHTRFTSLMGDFSDSTSLVLDENEKQLLIKKVLKLIDDQSVLLDSAVKYVLSDSSSFLSYIKENTNYKILEGSPKHLENKNSDLENHSKTFVDFYFLVNSDLIFLIKADKMYNSAFSKYASILGNKSFKLLEEK